MAVDPSIANPMIANPAGAMFQGAQMGHGINQIKRTNALNNAYAQNWPGLLAGDPAAYNALAMIDGREALNAQKAHVGLQFDQAQLAEFKNNAERAAAEHAATIGGSASAAEAAKLDKVLGMLKVATPENFEQVKAWAQKLYPDQNFSEATYEMLPVFIAMLQGSKPAYDAVAARAGPEYSQITGDEAAAAGLDPSKVYNVGKDGKIASIGASSVTVNNDPAPPTGYRNVYDENGRLVSQEVIPNGPADVAARAAAAEAERIAAADAAEAEKVEVASVAEAGARGTATDVIVSAASRAREANNKRLVGGAAGAVAAFNPANENAEVYRQVAVLKAQSKVENLLALKKASPTGASGFGALSQSEGDALEARAGGLDPASPYFERDLADYTLSVLRYVHGNEAGTAIFRETWEGELPPDSVGADTGGADVPAAWKQDPAAWHRWKPERQAEWLELQSILDGAK